MLWQRDGLVVGVDGFAGGMLLARGEVGEVGVDEAAAEVAAAGNIRLWAPPWLQRALLAVPPGEVHHVDAAEHDPHAGSRHARRLDRIDVQVIRGNPEDQCRRGGCRG